jgi:hypothetical protein
MANYKYLTNIEVWSYIVVGSDQDGKTISLRGKLAINNEMEVEWQIVSHCILKHKLTKVHDYKSKKVSGYPNFT